MNLFFKFLLKEILFLFRFENSQYLFYSKYKRIINRMENWSLSTNFLLSVICQAFQPIKDLARHCGTPCSNQQTRRGYLLGTATLHGKWQEIHSGQRQTISLGILLVQQRMRSNMCLYHVIPSFEKKNDKRNQLNQAQLISGLAKSVLTAIPSDIHPTQTTYLTPSTPPQTFSPAIPHQTHQPTSTNPLQFIKIYF